MTKKTAIATQSWLITLTYVFLGYVAVHHWGWLDGMAALLGFNLLVGAIRTKTNWEDFCEPETKP